MVLHPAEHVGEVGLRVRSHQTAVLHKGEDHGRSRPGVFMTDEQRVLRSEANWTKCVFGQVVVDARRRMAKTFSQRKTYAGGPKAYYLKL